jgi:hypothetical protein
MIKSKEYQIKYDNKVFILKNDSPISEVILVLRSAKSLDLLSLTGAHPLYIEEHIADSYSGIQEKLSAFS